MMEQTLIQQLLVMVGVILATQGVKKLSFIPINSGQKARIRTFVGVATFVATALTAWSDGNLESVLSPDMINVGVTSAVTFLLAHWGYKGVVAPLGNLMKK